MKVAYLSQSALSDVDFSYIKEAQKIMDITYYILVSPSQRQKAAINLNSLPDRFGIIPAVELKELMVFGQIVNLEKVFVVNYTSRSNHQLSKITEAYKVYRELVKKKYDVVHLTMPPSYLDPFIYKLRKRIVLTVHDPFPHSSQVSGIREYERRKAFRKINHLILLNKDQKQQFVTKYHLGNSSKHVYDSFLSRYDYLDIYSGAQQTVDYNKLVFFGQIFSHKGVNYLLEAMKEVHEVLPNLKLVVAGSGKFWFDISEYDKLDYIDIQNRFIPDDELVTMISSSAIVVVPYIDATQSGVIMTAYAFNRPCIATNVGGLPEMVKDEENGIIVQPKSAHALAKAIIELSQNRKLIDSFSDNIKREYSSGGKSWKQIALQHLNIYRNIYKI